MTTVGAFQILALVTAYGSIEPLGGDLNKTAAFESAGGRDSA
jgi:hypothetical protein